MIDVALGGDYKLALRQQPAAARSPIQATRARVKIGELEAYSPIAPGATSATLTVNLKAGKARLETWLTDEAVNK